MSEPVQYHLGGFPPASLDWERIAPIASAANRALGRYDGLLEATPNAAVLLAPLLTQEAVLSSRIEGTVVTMAEVLQFEAGALDDLTPEKRSDAEEVRNYRQALKFAAEAQMDRGLTPHLLREAHKLLMQGVRGEAMEPGAFRSEQNWIGRAGCVIENASFIPIPQMQLAAGLETWAAFIADRAFPDPLVQLALAHAEFEALHPFKDGNGRLGRMLIPLFLAARGLLVGPHFYMSGYLEERRDEYIDQLRSISASGSWTEWCLFFLQGIIEQSKENQRRAMRILSLHNRMQHEIADLTGSRFAPATVDFIFDHPVFSSATFSEVSGVPFESANRILRLIRDAGIVTAVREGAGRRAAVYAFLELILVAEGRDAG